MLYAPRALVDLRPNGGAHAVTGAVVARAFRSETPSNRPGPTIGSANAPRSDGDVVYTASIGSTQWASARVWLGGGGTQPPTIARWVGLR